MCKTIIIYYKLIYYFKKTDVLLQNIYLKTFNEKLYIKIFIDRF